MTAAPSDRRAIITEALRKIDDLTARLEIAEKGDTEPIAVVGMGCRLPGGADTPDQFWRLLQDGGSGIVGVPSGRWDADAFYSDDHSVPGTIVSKEGGFLTSWRPDEFDAEFFGISPREAAAMDPQQRLLLEVTWEALENAGITAPIDPRHRRPVFRRHDHQRLHPDPGRPAAAGRGRPARPVGQRRATSLPDGCPTSSVLHGPAVVLDTACSSSLVAVHLACQSLRRRECDLALAGGVNLMLTPGERASPPRAGACWLRTAAARPSTPAPTATSAARAAASWCSSGSAMRCATGTRVLAVIRGSAVNQDGRSSGLTVPSGPAQQAVMRSALAAARLRAADIDYVEAHGTGTALGDPIELGALQPGASASATARRRWCWARSRPTSGHLEAAAGIAGFIKTVLTVQHG